MLLRIATLAPCCRRNWGDKAGELTRATAFGNRTISGQRRDTEEGRGDDREDADASDSVEMAAMAKVWAHPEDLHKYPVSLPGLLV